MPRLVNGPCLLNVVWRGKTPEVAFGEAEQMGYRLAIVPGLLFKAVIGICDAMLSELRSTDRHPVPMQQHDGSRGVPARRGRRVGRGQQSLWRREAGAGCRPRSSAMAVPMTLFDKIWSSHAILVRPDGATLLHIDRHLVHDGSGNAFRHAEGERAGGAAARPHLRDAGPLRLDAQPRSRFDQ